MELGPCIEAPCKHGDYPRRWYEGKAERAYRVVWMEANGPIPKGHRVHHRCENTACVRLDHLQLMTHREHIRHHQGCKAHPGRLSKPRPNGAVQCLECDRLNKRRYREKRRNS